MTKTKEREVDGGSEGGRGGRRRPERSGRKVKGRVRLTGLMFPAAETFKLG